jgi:SH3 domain-containing YSC84-like protein 1
MGKQFADWFSLGECKKAAKILASFVDPHQSFGPDKIIPAEILSRAKGLAIITVIKAGFLGSGRFGSGVVVARLSDGTWSAPSAIATVGGGFGGQIGFEITDFVFILNEPSAVRTFSQAGSITLGGNVSVAAGPVGRNAEAAGAASLKGVAGIFAYSKTKGLFAGVSLEGSVLVERKDANEKLYNRRVTARALLEGAIPAPVEAEPLMRILNSRVFSGNAAKQGDAVYNDEPVYADSHEDVTWQGQRDSAHGQTSPRIAATTKPNRSNTWQDDVYDRDPVQGVNRSYTSRVDANDRFEDNRSSISGKPKPSRPTAPKPLFGAAKKASMGADQAIAKFTFEGEQPGDLSFKKGDIITIVKRTESETDWWTGKIGDKEGIFPRYVKESYLFATAQLLTTLEQQLCGDCLNHSSEILSLCHALLLYRFL